MKIALIVGTRPNIVKAAALVPALKNAGHEVQLVHVGQHTDNGMAQRLYDELLLRPDAELQITSLNAPAALRFVEMQSAVGAWLYQEMWPELLMVVGDCDCTLAGALAAKKLGIPVAHVEAGLRSTDAVQENLNRVLVDHMSDWLFTSEFAAGVNLQVEGIHMGEQIHFVGNVMIDTLLSNMPRIKERFLFMEPERPYAVLTLHRAETVDDPKRLFAALAVAQEVAERMPVFFPVHPRTSKKKYFPNDLRNFRYMQPMGYLDFAFLLSRATVVLTDSGGVQEETTAMQIPCLTLRRGTERPSTLKPGTNIIVNENAYYAGQLTDEAMAGKWKESRLPDRWDGHAAERIAQLLQ